jgi:hypothetical protein
MVGSAHAVRSEGSGLLVRTYRSAIEELGLTAAVRARLSPACAQLLDEPPLPMAWVPGEWFSELLLALESVTGRAGCRRLGYLGARTGAGGVLAPLVRTSVVSFGATPATFLGRMGTLSTVLVRGITFAFTPDGPRAGTLTLRYPVPVSAAVFASWEGACGFVLEVSGCNGEVSEAQLAEGARTGHIAMRW